MYKKQKFLLQKLALLLFVLFFILIMPKFSQAADTTVRFYTSAGDGTVYQSTATWDDVRNATNGYIMEYELKPTSGINMLGLYGINRAFLPFNTSGLPNNAVIQSATLNVYIFEWGNSDDDGDDWVTVVQTHQDSTTQLIGSDFDKCSSVNSPIEGIDSNERRDITDVSTGQYITFSLNFVGLGWINTTGWTKLGLREGHDVLNTAYIGPNASANTINAHASDYPGTDYDPYLEVTYTLEEPQKEIDPVILIPGILGSWEKNEEWIIDPILHTYDNLIEAMLNSGYELNQSLFLFPFDWRESNSDTTLLLEQKIADVRGQTETEKVDIVAHSMGGLICRYYIASDNYNNNVDQVVFLGTPHKGAPKSYLKWEGASGFDSLGEKLLKIFFTHEAYVNDRDSLFDYIQNDIPSIKELLPDYAYLQEVGEVSLRVYDRINYPDNYPYNIFLENLNSGGKINQFISSGVNIFNIIGDTGDNTINTIIVSPGQDYWPKWQHGYAEEVIKLAGDDTVPDISSSLFIPTKINNTAHGELPTKAQGQIIEYLTGTMPTYEITEVPEAEKILVVNVYSPVDFVVIAPDGKMVGKDFFANAEINQIKWSFYSGFDTDTEFVTIINPLTGDYQVKLKGTDDGIYQLGIDILEDNSLEEPVEDLIPGIISMGTEEIFNFSYSTTSEGEVEIIVSKDIDFDGLIKDLEELDNNNEIKKKYVKKILDIRFQHLKELYEKWGNEEREWRQKILEKRILISLAIIKKQLKFYVSRDWITQIAYEILYFDINDLINKLN